MRLLATNGIPTADALPTRDDKNFTLIDAGTSRMIAKLQLDRYFFSISALTPMRVIKWLNGALMGKIGYTDDVVYKAGVLLGRFHAITRDYEDEFLRANVVRK